MSDRWLEVTSLCLQIHILYNNKHKSIMKVQLTSKQDQIYQSKKQQDQLLDDGEDQFRRKSILLEKKIKLIDESETQIWRNYKLIFIITVVLSISAMQFGYGIIQITTVYTPLYVKNYLVKQYNFKIPSGLAIGLMVSSMPIGALLGSFSVSLIVTKISKKKALILNNILCMLASFCFMQITIPATILIGRFIYGWCIACYICWSKEMIRQIIPPNLHASMIWIYTFAQYVSIALGYLFGILFYKHNVDRYYIFMFCLPGIYALFQLILLMTVVPQSPRDIFRQKRHEEGRKILEMIYKDQFIDNMFEKHSLEAEVLHMQKKYLVQTQHDITHKPNINRALAMGVFLTIYRHLSGVITVLLYSSILISQSSQNLGPYINFFLSLLLLISTTIGLVFSYKYKRRQSLMISSISLGICNFMIMTGLLVQYSKFTIVFMGLLIVAYGLIFSPIYELYLKQILKQNHASYVALTGWPSIIIASLIPPIIAQIMPKYIPWPIFLFYGIFSLLSIIYIWFYSKETKNKKYHQIIKQF